MTAIFVLNLLGIAAGMLAIGPRTIASEAGITADTQVISAVWAAVAAIIAFLLGGFVAARTAAIYDRGMGALNGALVFVFAVPITLWLAAQGVGAVVGGIAGFADQVGIVVRIAPDTMSPAALAEAMQNVRNGAIAVLIALVLGLVASAVGGALGVRRNVSHETRI
jgi:hypothetical protein